MMARGGSNSRNGRCPTEIAQWVKTILPEQNVDTLINCGLSICKGKLFYYKRRSKKDIDTKLIHSYDV